MPEFCTTERDGRVLVVTINRPEVLNALHPAASLELEKVIDEFEADPDLWVAIVTGAGRAFSAGVDLKHFAATGEMMTNKHGVAGLTGRYDGTKPLIAAVNGICAGGGFEIALACDLIIASEAAVFSLPEPRVGVAAVAGGIHRLPRMIPLVHAMGILLTGRRVSAQEGRELGFVNEVVPLDELIPAARRWADQILECAPLSVWATKESVMRGLDEPVLKSAVKGRYDRMKALYSSEDFQEGPRAFSEKRKPIWKAR